MSNKKKKQFHYYHFLGKNKNQRKDAIEEALSTKEQQPQKPSQLISLRYINGSFCSHGAQLSKPVVQDKVGDTSLKQNHYWIIF